MINIFGVIGTDVTFVDVMEQIQNDKSSELDVLIYSVGGSLYEGLAIHDALKNDPRKVTTTILGLGASSASAIFSAGDVRLVGDASEFMIHNVLVNSTGGNKYELMETVKSLDNEDQKLINIYESITSLSREELEQMMKKETKLNAAEAIEYGFATGKVNTMAMVAQFNNKTKDDKKMSDIEEKQVKGFFALCKEFFNKSETSEPVAEKAMDEEEEKKAMDEEEAKQYAESEKAMEEDPKAEEEEEPKAEEEEPKADEDSEEVKALKEKVASLELELQNKKELVNKKQDLIIDGIKDNKITLAQSKEYFAMSVDDVETCLLNASENSNGYGEDGIKPETSLNYHEQYKAITDPVERNKFYHNNIDKIQKDKFK